VFDFDVQNTFTIRLRTTDDGTGALIFEKIFTINVTDGNFSPTDITLSNNIVDENQVANTAIGTFTTIDPDASDIHTYSLVVGTSDTDNASFQISGNELQTNAVFDFETKNSYTIRVQTTDNGTGALTYEEVFTLTINNLNDAPTDIYLSNDHIEGGLPEGTFVGTLTSTDQDNSDNHSYSLVSGAGDNDNASFRISGNELQTNVVFNYDLQNIYTIRLRTTDDGTNNLIFEKTVTIIVTEPYINYKPVITNESGIEVDTLHFTTFVNESLDICINAFDPNNDQIKFTNLLVEKGNAETANANDETLCFKTIPGLDFIGQVFLTVIVQDNGTPILYDTVIISLWVEPKLETTQGISPNGDGINDFLVISGIEKYPNNTVTLFNRWGNIVYSKKEYDNVNEVWPTNLNNTIEGTYFYIIDIEGYKKPIRDFIVIKR
jgi:gliding motility-associated-like protein